MKIDKSLHDDYATLTLKGEFDSFYCPKLSEEVESLLGDGTSNIVLNLRLTKFINSTALGAIIKAFKRCKAEGGQLVLARPSAFARQIITKLGIDQLVPMFDDEAEARKKVVAALNEEALAAAKATTVEEGKVLVTFPEEIRAQQAQTKKNILGANVRTIVGTMLNVDPERLQFSWSGAKSGLTVDQAVQLFPKGSPLNLKFQVKLFKKGYFDVSGEVLEATPADDSVRVSVRYKEITDAELEALRQFAADLAYLRNQLPGGQA